MMALNDRPPGQIRCVGWTVSCGMEHDVLVFVGEGGEEDVESECSETVSPH